METTKELNKVTESLIKKAFIHSQVQFFPARQCSICQVFVYYIFNGEDLFFDSSCGCCASGFQRAASFTEIEHTINHTNDEDTKNRLLAASGITKFLEDTQGTGIYIINAESASTRSAKGNENLESILERINTSIIKSANKGLTSTEIFIHNTNIEHIISIISKLGFKTELTKWLDDGRILYISWSK